MTDQDPTAPTWAVFRLDFAGNNFLVADRLTLDDATALAAEYESRGHHQHYWAARSSSLKVDWEARLREQLAAGSPLNAALQVLRSQGASDENCRHAVANLDGAPPPSRGTSP